MEQIKRVPLWEISQMSNSTPQTGIHLVADFWGGKMVEQEEELKRILLEAALRANSTALQVCIHKFQPEGITGMILLAESHITIHTWPEIHYMAVDIFTCGARSNPRAALQYLEEVFAPSSVHMDEVKRGVQTK